MLFLLLLLCIPTAQLFAADAQRPGAALAGHVIRSAIVASLNILPGDYAMTIASGTIALPTRGLLLDESGHIACGPDLAGEKLYLFHYLDKAIIAQKTIPCAPALKSIATSRDRRVGIVVSHKETSFLRAVGYVASGEHVHFWLFNPPESPVLALYDSSIIYAHPHKYNENGTVKTHTPILTINSDKSATNRKDLPLNWHPITKPEAQSQ